MNEQDRDDILDIIDDWKKSNGKPATDSTKKQYKIAFKSFLDKHGKKTKNKELHLGI